MLLDRALEVLCRFSYRDVGNADYQFAVGGPSKELLEVPRPQPEVADDDVGIEDDKQHLESVPKLSHGELGKSGFQFGNLLVQCLLLRLAPSRVDIRRVDVGLEEG